ncbi:MAG: DUF1499 domain-containing protein [Microcoleaceae cyanobacterium]
MMKKLLTTWLTSTMFVLMATLLITTVSFFGLFQPVLAQPSSSYLIGSIFSFSGNRPDNLGIENGHLKPCPDSPNCVSSESLDAEHKIEPLNVEETTDKSFEKLKMVIETMDNAEIITEQDTYLYAEFTTPILGFVDDVEFYINQEQDVIQVRSASRLGESDLGVNRRRVETIRVMFES